MISTIGSGQEIVANTWIQYGYHARYGAAKLSRPTKVGRSETEVVFKCRPLYKHIVIIIYPIIFCLMPFELDTFYFMNIPVTEK